MRVDKDARTCLCTAVRAAVVVPASAVFAKQEWARETNRGSKNRFLLRSESESGSRVSVNQSVGVLAEREYDVVWCECK
jgi:hypothetical protein